MKSGLAVAAVAATSTGCNDVQISSAFVKPQGGWYQVPGILADILPPQFPSKEFSILDYGAVGNGSVNCHPAFVAAIKACNATGGGRVVVPAGNFLTNGPIHLLSHVNLYLEAGSTVRFGINPADYLPTVLVRWQGIRCYNYSPLIYAFQQENIAVTGKGTLVGNASNFWSKWIREQGPDYDLLQKMGFGNIPVEQRIFGEGHHLRPTMFEPYECKNILVEGVTFQGSPFWTIHPTFCTNVTIQDVTVLAGTSNDDGCDPDSCQNVLIKGCTFATVDDSISIKAGGGPDAQGLPPCQNIVVQDCLALSTNWSAFTMGSNTSGNIENVFFENCVVNSCTNAFFIKSNKSEGGTVQNVWFRFCKAIECHNLIFLAPAAYSYQDHVDLPLFSGINFENISCEKALSFVVRSEGDPGRPIRFLTFDSIAVGSAPSVADIKASLLITWKNVTVGGRRVSL